MTRIKHSKGRTINMGNFESVRVDIGIEIEGENIDEDLDLERLKNWVNAKLAKESASK